MSITLHVVALGIDPDCVALREGLETIRAGCTHRAQRMGEELAAAGIADAYAGAMKFVTSARLISRTHFARFLVEGGHARDTRDCFRRYLVRGKPGYVAHAWATLAQAIGWIHAAGGHGYSRIRDDTRSTGRCASCSPEFRDTGGDAIEVVSGSHTPAQYTEFARYARVFGMLASSGSDFHGPGESWADLGDTPPLPAGVTPVLERLVSLPAPRTVFFVSDRTGITAEMLGNSLLSQFEGLNFQRRTIPFVDTRTRSTMCCAGSTRRRRPRAGVRWSSASIVDEIMSAQLGRANAMVLDLFQVFIAPLEAELAAKSSHAAGRSHGIANSHEYFARMEAINFTQAHDDGATTRDLAKAQVILIGVPALRQDRQPRFTSRLQFGILTANFPLTPDDFVDRKLPRSIVPFRRQALRPDHRPRAFAADPRGPPPGQPIRRLSPIANSRSAKPHR